MPVERAHLREPRGMFLRSSSVGRLLWGAEEIRKLMVAAAGYANHAMEASSLPEIIQYLQYSREVLDKAHLRLAESLGEIPAPNTAGYPTLADARQVMLMVRHLHRQGYGLLRIAPSLPRVSLGWKCQIAPSENFSSDHGAVLNKKASTLPLFSTVSSNGFFGLQGLSGMSSGELARIFSETFPEILRQSQGEDEAYTNWFSNLLAITADNFLFYAFGPNDPPAEHLYDFSFRGSNIIPSGLLKISLPPPPKP